MVRPSERTGTKRKISVRTTKGTVEKYKLRKPSKAQCAACGVVLSGVPHERPYKLQNMPKTKKRPSRAFGGVLCSKCSTKLIKESVRNV